MTVSYTPLSASHSKYLVIKSLLLLWLSDVFPFSETNYFLTVQLWKIPWASRGFFYEVKSAVTSQVITHKECKVQLVDSAGEGQVTVGVMFYGWF